MKYYLFILIIYSALFYIIPKKNIKWVMLLTVIMFSVMAFYAVPKETDDLYGYYLQLNLLRRGGWRIFQKMIADDANHWGAFRVCGFYYYLISRLPKNGFLPGITIFISYGSIMLIMYKLSLKYNVNKFYLYIATLFILITFWFYDICSGIRNGLAFSVFSLFLYFDYFENKNKILCYVGYALCAGMHNSVIMLVSLRVAAVLTKKYGSKIINVAMPLAISIGGSIIQKIGEITNLAYFQVLSEKASGNINRAMDLSKTFIWVNTSVLIVVILISLYVIPYIDKSPEGKKIGDFKNYYIMILCFTASSFVSQLIYIRLIRWLIPVFGAMMFMIGMQIIHDNEEAVRLKTKSIIRSRNKLLAENELILITVLIGYMCIHLWYTCTGSSLIWLHFS